MTDANEQSLVEHLTELRKRLINVLIILALGTLAGWIYSEVIFDFIRKPILPHLSQSGLVFTGVVDKFIAHLKVSVLSGVILTCPLWLYQVWLFVAPGLYKNEKKYAVAFLTTGSLLFISGALFVYFIVLPLAFEYLLNFGSDLDKPMITIDSYISFFLLMSAVFGVAFELPLILVMLGLMGVIDARFLREKRRYAIVLLAVFCAVITPPDIMSMTFLLAPLWILYEVSIFIIQVVQKP